MTLFVTRDTEIHSSLGEIDSGKQINWLKPSWMDTCGGQDLAGWIPVVVKA